MSRPDSGEVARWRAATPGCEHRNHLNNAGAALMPRPVLDACVAHLQLEAEIGGYEAADARAGETAGVYESLGELIGAHPRNVAIVANATAGFIQAMSSFDLAQGDVIVTTRADYTSYQITFLSLAQRLGVVGHPAGLADPLDDPGGVAGAVRHVQQLVLQRRGTGVEHQREPGHEASAWAWIAVIATVETMSSTSAPRDRSLTGLARPCSTGPR